MDIKEALTAKLSCTVDAAPAYIHGKFLSDFHGNWKNAE